LTLAVKLEKTESGKLLYTIFFLIACNARLAICLEFSNFIRCDTTYPVLLSPILSSAVHYKTLPCGKNYLRTCVEEERVSDGIFMPLQHLPSLSLQQDASLVTNFSNKKLLVIIITNLDTSLQSKKIINY